MIHGREIKRARKARGITRYRLAILADVDWRTVNDLEKGRRQPQSETMRKIVNGLNKVPVLKIRT